MYPIEQAVSTDARDSGPFWERDIAPCSSAYTSAATKDRIHFMCSKLSSTVLIIWSGRGTNLRRLSTHVRLKHAAP